MQISGSVALITGANRGIGAEFVRQLQQRGASKIYAAARVAESIRATGVHVLSLDVTDHAQIAEIAAHARDVNLLINNAGTSSGLSLVEGNLESIRAELETNFFGPLALTRAFAPTLSANGGGAILNVLSAASWFAAPGATVYAASKAAAWSSSDGVRLELAGQGTQVLGLHMGMVDTDMTADFDVAKISPTMVVQAALDGLETGSSEVVVDEIAKSVKDSLALDPAERYAGFLGQ